MAQLFCIVTNKNELHFVKTSCNVGSQWQVAIDVFYWTYEMGLGTDISSGIIQFNTGSMKPFFFFFLKRRRFF